MFSQVGLIAINVLGEYNNKIGDFNNDNLLHNNNDKLEDEMKYDPQTLKRLKNLFKAKTKAIEYEDFDEAKKIKEAIDRLKSVSQQLIQLEERKRIAIKNDDFDSAKILKFEIERLRNAVVGINLNEDEREKQHMNKFNIDKLNNEKQGNKNKTKLLAGDHRPKYNEVPLTSDLIIPDSNDKHVAKNINNNDIKLRNKEDLKYPKDVDKMVIKGMSRDFREVINDKMNKELKKDYGDDENMEEEEISVNDYKKAEPLIPILTHDIVKKIFSKYWRNKEEAMRILNTEVQNFPQSDLLGQQQADKLILAIVTACSYVLQCNVSQASLAALELIKVTLNKFRTTNLPNYLRPELNSAVDQCLISILEKIGDSNLKLKEKAGNTVLEFANSRLIGHKIVFEHLIAGQIKKTLLNSAKHLSGRLDLISRMIENFGLNIDEIPVDTLMSFALNGYKNANKEVRDAAFNLIMNIYKYFGAGIRGHLKDLRPAQLNILEEGFENVDNGGGVGNYQGGGGNESEGNDEFNNQSNMIMVEELRSNSRGKAGKMSSNKMANNNYENNNDSREGNIVTNHLDISNSIDNKITGNKDEASCHLCGAFDPNFDEDTILMHYYKECPMVLF
jgi:centrosomal protein CEP104